MRKRTKVVLGCIIVLIAMFWALDLDIKINLQRKKDRFQLIEVESTMDLSRDVVFYPFSIGMKGYEIDSFAIDGDKVIPINQKLYMGVGQVVSAEALEVLYSYFKVDDYSELKDDLGQYMMYKNFDGMEVLVFYKWNEEPSDLHVVFIQDETVTVVSEKKGKGYIPESIQKYEDSIVIVMQHENKFSISRIDTQKYTIEVDEFVIPDRINSHRLINTAYVNDQLYLMINVYNKHSEDQRKRAHMYTYDMEQKSLSSKRISGVPVDFLTNDNEGQVLCYGMLEEENRIRVYRENVVTGEYDESVIQCPDKLKNIVERAVFYEDGQLYIYLDLEEVVVDGIYYSVLYGYNFDEGIMVNRVLHSSDSAMEIKFFKKNTEYRHDASYGGSW